MATDLQQIGLMYTSIGHSSFISALYIILVPLFVMISGKVIRLNIWFSVLISGIGLYLICINVNTKTFLNSGDIITFFAAFAFALHIIVLDHYSERVDVCWLSCIQFFTVGIISLIFSMLFEQHKYINFSKAIGSLMYAGIMGCGVGFTFQAIGQTKVNTMTASLILSLESCFATIFAWLFLKERLNFREIIGCCLMMCGVILSQTKQKESTRS